MSIINNKRRTKDELLLEHGLAVLQGISESKSNYRKIIQAGIAKWVADFKNGKIEINSVSDLKQLIELDIELQKDDL